MEPFTKKKNENKKKKKKLTTKIETNLNNDKIPKKKKK